MYINLKIILYICTVNVMQGQSYYKKLNLPINYYTKLYIIKIFG